MNYTTSPGQRQVVSAYSYLAECVKVHLFGELLSRGHGGGLAMNARGSIILLSLLIFSTCLSLSKIFTKWIGRNLVSFLGKKKEFFLKKVGHLCFPCMDGKPGLWELSERDKRGGVEVWREMFTPVFFFFFFLCTWITPLYVFIAWLVPLFMDIFRSAVQSESPCYQCQLGLSQDFVQVGTTLTLAFCAK